MRKQKFLVALILIAFGVFVTLVSNSGPGSKGPGGPNCHCPPPKGRPVCIIETGRRYEGACQAQCAGYTPDEYVSCYAQ